MCGMTLRGSSWKPFFIARIGSPLKYAVRCSNSVKSSTDRRLRFDPWICWLNSPRRLTVSIRNRRSCGRMSGLRWNCAVVCPLTWQSRHATPICGFGLLRSSVRLNSSCGSGVSSSRIPSSCTGVMISLNSARKLFRFTTCPRETSPSSGRFCRKIAGGNSGRNSLGRSNSTSNRSSRGNIAICTCGNTCPPLAWSGCGNDG